MPSLTTSELCREREARTMARRFAPWLINQLNLAMSIRLGSGLTDAQKQRIDDRMQEMIEDVLADCGMAPAAKTSGVPLTVVAGSADAGSDARAYPEGLSQARA
jgi:hypothetical protein